MKKSANPPQTARPTIVTIAELAGVSIATVSNALNDRPYVDPQTRARVRAAAEQLGYTPNLRARRLRTGRADTIAIFSSMPFAVAGGQARMGYLMEIAGAAAMRALEDGIALILVPPLEHGRAPFADLHIDGALVVAPIDDDPEVALLRHRQVPVVSIDRQIRDDGLPFIDMQNRQGAQLLLDHLHAQGCRKIALLVGAQPRQTSADAMAAYADFTRRHAMPAHLLRVPEPGGEGAARQMTIDLLTRQPDIDGILAFIDVFAIGALAGAKSLGRRVPQDIKLATRHDGHIARETDPPLTALNLHLPELGALGVELLLARINGDAAAAAGQGPAPLVVPRASSARG